MLNICFNYGGRWDIVQAAARLAQEGKPITESSLSAAMALAHVPDPDLVIRTGAETRISNFCCGSQRTLSFISVRRCGRTLVQSSSMQRLLTLRSVNAALAKPLNK